MKFMNNRALNKNQRREIKLVFKDYSGDLTRNQKKLLDKYRISYSMSGNNHIIFGYVGRTTVSSHSSSDWRTGRNLATRLIKLVSNELITS